jgi:hypothetical protein
VEKETTFSAPAEELVTPKVTAPVSVKAECTRDTRGANPCAIKDCENCN